MKIWKERISITECKQLLKKNGRAYSDKEVLAIRDFLYEWAEINYRIYEQALAKEESFIINEEELKTAA